MAAHKLLKRKGGVDEVSDDLLSSPATKIRRLDAELAPIVEEEEPLPLPPNQERALVLFKPPSSFSVTLNSDLISAIKSDQFPWSKQRDRLIGSQKDQNESNNELALVPWVPSPSYHLSTLDDSDNANTELMEADEMGGESMVMDMEEEQGVAASDSSTSTTHYPTTPNLYQQHPGITEGFQQHCLLPQLPQNTSTPITWTR